MWSNIMIVRIYLDSADTARTLLVPCCYLLADLEEPAWLTLPAVGSKSIIPHPLLTKKEDLVKYSHPLPPTSRTVRAWTIAAWGVVLPHLAVCLQSTHTLGCFMFFGFKLLA